MSACPLVLVDYIRISAGRTIRRQQRLKQSESFDPFKDLTNPRRSGALEAPRHGRAHIRTGHLSRTYAKGRGVSQMPLRVRERSSKDEKARRRHTPI